MYFPVSIILASTFIVDCAPKLGHMLFDPLEFEAAKHIGQGDVMRRFDVSSDDEFLENEPITEITKQPPPPFIINQINIQSETNRKISTKPLNGLKNAELNNLDKTARRQAAQGNVPKFGYEFDPSRCMIINGDKRIICGYDKNKGDIPQEQPIIPFPPNNDCRIRADRIECGYVEGGYILARRKAFSNTPDLYSLVSHISYPMSRITFPKVSPQLVTNFYNKTTSKPTSNLKLLSNSVTPLPTTIRIILKVANLSTGELTSGKMTTPLLTSRSGIVSSKIKAENKHRDTLPNPSTLLSAQSPIVDKISAPPEQKEILTKMLEDKPIGRIGKESEAANFGGCSSCVLKKILRGPDVAEGTTKKSVTRCVEIGDRIVCYPVKTPATTPVVAP